jgi:hypothetical protein
MPGNRAALSPVPYELDQMPGPVRFRTARPEVVILLPGALPKAWVGGRKIEHPMLRGLLDEPEEAFSPRAGSSGDRGHQAGTQ